jgi:hypothetical protein
MQFFILFFRTGYEKKRKAVAWCGNNTMKWLQGENEEALPSEPKIIKTGPTPDRQFDDNEPHTMPPGIGDVVAVPFRDKETKKPSFWLGKCLRVNQEDSTVLLGWFQQVGEFKYKMKIGASWLEVCGFKNGYFSQLIHFYIYIEYQSLYLSH